MTTIAYIGNFTRPWCTEVHVARDARALGHTVVEIQEPSDEPSIGWAKWFDFVLRTVQDEGVDLVLYTRTWGLPDDAAKLWQRCERRGVATAAYHLDLYVGLKRQRDIAENSFWKTGTVFTADGDPGTFAVMRNLGVNHCWLPAACVSDECHPSETRVQEVAPIVFVGSHPDGYHDEWPWRRKLLRGLRMRYGDQFRRYPVGEMRLYNGALNEVLTSATVVVGDSLALPGHSNYWSDRFYENVGRGGFLVAPHVPGIDAHFTSGEHLMLYDLGDLDHVLELVDEALDDPYNSRQIAIAGSAHVREHHTYRNRVEELLYVCSRETLP